MVDSDVRVNQRSGIRLFATAGLLNAVGVGFYYPFALLFFSGVVQIEIVTVGAVLTATTLLSLPLLPFAGIWIDRWSSRKVLAISLFSRSICFLLIIATQNLVAFAALAFAIALFARIERPASMTFARECADRSELGRWYAASRAVFAAGYGVGTAAAAVAVSLDSEAALLAGYINSAALAMAAVLYLSIRTRHDGADSDVTEQGENQSSSQNMSPFGRKAYLTLSASYAAAYSTGLLMETLLIPYLLLHTSAPKWLGGALLSVNCILLGILYVPLESRLAKARQLRVVFLAAALIGVGMGAIAATPALGSSSLIVFIAVIGMIVYSAGEMLSDQTHGVLVTVLSPPAATGTHLSYVQLVSGVTSAFVPLIASALLAHPSVAAWSGVLIAPAAAATFLLVRRTRDRLDRPVADIV